MTALGVEMGFDGNFLRQQCSAQSERMIGADQRVIFCVKQEMRWRIVADVEVRRMQRKLLCAQGPAKQAFTSRKR